MSKTILEDVFRMDAVDTLDDERKKKLRQTQVAAQSAARDPETGLLKVSGAIQGVPKTEPGGDLYGVDPQGRAFVVTSKKRTPPTASTPTTPTTSTAATPAVSSPATVTRNWGTGATQNFPDMSKVPGPVEKMKSKFDVATIADRAVEADRQNRIRKAEALAPFTPGFGAGKGEGGTNIVPLQASDIRPQGMDRGAQRQIAPPRAQTPIAPNILPNIIAPKAPLNPNAPTLQSATGSSLGAPGLERIRADEMDPRIQRQKARVAAERAARARQAYRSPAQGTGLLAPSASRYQ